MNQRVRVILAGLAALVLAPLASLPAAAAVGDPITVTGTVTDADGAPLEGVTVSVYHSPGTMESTTTDAGGVYSVTYASTIASESLLVITDVPDVRCDYGGLVSAPATVVINCAIPDLITVRFSGHVAMSDGSNPAGQWISANDSSYMYSASAPIAPDGTFSLDVEVPADAWYIELRGPGMGSTQVSGFEDGTVYSGLELVFDPYPSGADDVDMTVTGHVTDRRGRPLVGASVSVYSGYNGFFAETDANGDYSITGAWPWYDGQLGTEAPAIEIDGAVVDVLDGLNPDTPTVVDYRQGKTPVFEEFRMGIDMDYMGEPTDLYRKIGADGVAQWRVCSAGGYCYFFTFGDKRTEFVGVMPSDPFAGITMALLRDKNDDGGYDWYRFGPDNVLNEQATFGTRHPEGLAYFSFESEAGLDVVEWDSSGGQTSIWSWGVADGLAGVQTTVLEGRLVSFDHQDLDGNGLDDVVVVARHGKTHTVYLLTSSTAEPMVVAEGRGAPTVTYEDVDGDGALDVVAAFGA